MPGTESVVRDRNYRPSLERRQQLWASTKDFKPDAETINFIQNKLIPTMGPAIKKAENDPGRFGVRSVQTDNPGQVLKNSIHNSYLRWLQAGKPGKFVDFMWDRWAPIGAENDPKYLNVNWGPNVRHFLEKQLGEDQYKDWQGRNLARRRALSNTGVA